jgi:arylsulfatase A-like enzyme
LIALVAVSLSACGAQVEQPRPDVILIVIDTLRADALSSYGNPRLTTPHLDKLAEGGLLFEQAYSHAPNTAPSHATLFTGLHP